MYDAGCTWESLTLQYVVSDGSWKQPSRPTVAVKCEHWTSLLDFLPPRADLQPLKTAEHSYTDYEDKLWVGGKNLRVSYSVANPLPAQPALLCVIPTPTSAGRTGRKEDVSAPSPPAREGDS